MNLSQFASQPQGKAAPASIELPQVYVDFMREVSAQGVRLTYEANSAILGHLNLLTAEQAKLPSTGNRHITALPLDLQFTVCRKNGSYHEDVRSKWVDQAPQGFEQRPVIGVENALTAFQQFQAGRTEAKPEKATKKSGK